MKQKQILIITINLLERTVLIICIVSMWTIRLDTPNTGVFGAPYVISSKQQTMGVILPSARIVYWDHYEISVKCSKIFSKLLQCE